MIQMKNQITVTYYPKVNIEMIQEELEKQLKNKTSVTARLEVAKNLYLDDTNVIDIDVVAEIGHEIKLDKTYATVSFDEYDDKEIGMKDAISFVESIMEELMPELNDYEWSHPFLEIIEKDEITELPV